MTKRPKDLDKICLALCQVMVIKLLNTIFVLVLDKQPIRTLLEQYWSMNMGDGIIVMIVL
jgi:hypothetical protein